MPSTLSVRGPTAGLVGSILGFASLVGIGCPAPADTAPVAPEPTSAALDTSVEPVDPVELGPGLRVDLHPRLAPTPELGVHIEVTGPTAPDEALRVWSLPGPIAAAPTFVIHDAQGELGHSVERTDSGVDSGVDSGGVRVTLDRAPTLPLTLDYALAPVAARPGELARLELDEARLFATGEAVIVLPEAALDRRLNLALNVDPTVFEPTPAPEAAGAESDTTAEPAAVGLGLPPVRAASNFAPEAEAQFEGWPFELRRVSVVAGRVEWARFDSKDGQDRWLGVGRTRFDQRWSAAELAGVRSFIDGRLGLRTTEPMVTIAHAGSHLAAEPSVRAELRGRGLVLDIDELALWDVVARMAVSQALVRRWLGGVIRVWTRDPGAGDSLAEAEEAEALWFEAGATRFVARELLWELGLLDDHEYSAELNQIEVELASSPVRDRSLAELAALAASTGQDLVGRTEAQAQLVARGAAYMAWLDAELRASRHGSDGVIEILRILVTRSVANQRRDIPLSELLHLAATRLDIHAPPDEAVLARFEAVVGAGQRPALGPDAYGPCFRPRKRKLRRFELGFVDHSRFGDERPSFTALDPAGPAAAAGLRPDDQLISAYYVSGDPAIRVELELERDGAVVRLDYVPAGPKRSVIQWERVPDVPPEACVR